MQRIVLLALCACAWSELGLAQTETRSKKKKRDHTRPAESSATEDGPAASPGEPDDSTPARSRSQWLPSWRPRAFDWSLSPIIASQYTQYDRQGSKTTQSSFELGAVFGLTGIPVVARNPGLTLGASIGRAWGSLSEKLSSPDTPTSTTSSRYTRSVGDVSATALFGFYKHELTIGRGRLEYAKEALGTTQSAWVTNDGGVRILPWLSEHLTWKWSRGFADDFDRPFLATSDLWLHTRMQFDTLSLYVDVGPGMSLSEEYTLPPAAPDVIARGRTDYVQLLSSVHLFWKLGASLGAKYIYNATSDQIGRYVTTRLPQQELGGPSAVVPPEDSLVAYSFVGLRKLFGGWGLGWHYNLQIYRLGGNAEGDELRVVDQGFGLSYETSF